MGRHRPAGGCGKNYASGDGDHTLGSEVRGGRGGAVAAERIGEREAELKKGAIGGSKTRAIGG